jgi:hypothetical protein
MILYIRDPALFPVIITCALLFVLFAGTLIAYLYVNKENEKKILGLIKEVDQLGVEFQHLNSLRGSCQVTYNKTEKEKVKNYAFDFIGLDDLHGQLRRFKNPDQVALFIKDTKQFYDRK